MSRRFTCRITAAALALLALLPCGLRAADDEIASARKTLAEAKDTVVTVRCVLKLKYSYTGGNQDKEQKLEVSATTVDPAGIFVTSSESVLLNGSMKAVMAANSKIQLKIQTEVTDVSVMLSDGTEAAGDLVCTDKDLDVAFIRLREKPSAPLPAVALTPATGAEALDPVYVLSRAPKSSSRVPLLLMGHITGKVKGPQPYYLGDLTIANCLGCVVYTADGKPLGLEVVKATSGDETADAGMNGRIGALIRPLDQLAELTKQALAAPAKASPAAASPGAAPAKPATVP